MMRNELPEGWLQLKLGELFLIERGGSPRPIENFITDDEDGINWIKIGDTKGVTRYIYSTKEKIRPEGLQKSRMVYEGDFILSNSMSFGRPYIMKTRGCIHDGWLVIRIDGKKIDSNYLYHVLSSMHVYNQFSTLAKGSTVRNLNIQAVNQVSIFYPPLAEQKRIVAKLDMAFAYLETLKASLARIPELLKTFRQSVLTQAVTGKLTEDWRVGREFDVETEIDAIKKERYQILSTRKKNLFEECGDKSSINSWAKIYIEEIFDVQTGSTPKRDIDRYWDEGDIPWIKSGQVSNRDITEADEFITELALTETNAKLYPTNSILIAMYGEGKTRGQVGILKFEATSNQAIAAMVNPHLNDFTIKYVFLFGLSQYDEIRKEAAGGNQPNLNTGKIKKWKIDFPPLKEQEEIVKRVDVLFAKADAIEAQYLSLKEKIDRLPQALLAKAFRGELVLQDPADEPASVLLEKIQKEMGKLGKKGKKQMELVFED